MTARTNPSASGPGGFAGMTRLRGGEILMGCEDYYPEEMPIRRAEVGDFWIDTHPVTNRQFAEFVDATGYVTFAEIPPDPKDYPGMAPQMAKAGSAVFSATPGPVPLDNPGNWWNFVFGASWKHPSGPSSSIENIMDHPVVQVAFADALAYAAWAGKALPTEAEWEFAARGGLQQKPFAWGDDLMPDGVPMANYWIGEFPWQKQARPGFDTTSPVGSFPPNGYGLHDMIGNVWEWTEDWYSPDATGPAKGCCGPPRARLATKAESYDPFLPQQRIGRKVCKGGSHLCAANYCERYRPAARHPQAVDSPTSHTGFRCIARID
jgi:formylglycine-generating enzyme required for sulfatase activity